MTTYLYPFARGTVVSQRFRSNPNWGANGPGGHTGEDAAVKAGTFIRAAGDGVIEHSDWFSDYYGDNPWWLTSMGGDTLVLNCGNDKPTFVYAHCLETLANVKDRVVKGQIIAISGNSGKATTGDHCHIEAMPPNWDYNNGVYGRVDPRVYMTEYYTEPKAGDKVTEAQLHELKQFIQSCVNNSINKMWASNETLARLVQDVGEEVEDVVRAK